MRRAIFEHMGKMSQNQNCEAATTHAIVHRSHLTLFYMLSFGTKSMDAAILKTKKIHYLQQIQLYEWCLTVSACCWSPLTKKGK
jgi:hypothetical protein